jgi:hypothetical protein
MEINIGGLTINFTKIGVGITIDKRKSSWKIMFLLSSITVLFYYVIWPFFVLTTPTIAVESKVNLLLALAAVVLLSYMIAKKRREGIKIPLYDFFLNFFRIMLLLSLFVFGKQVIQYWFI